MKVVLLPVAAIVILSSGSFICGQIPAGQSSRDITTVVQQSEDRVTTIIAQAEGHFRKGKPELEENKRGKARNDFDKAIDSILESGLDVRANQRLLQFYLQLVERIYREEVPSQGGKIGFSETIFEPSPLDEVGKVVIPKEPVVSIHKLPPLESMSTSQKAYRLGLVAGTGAD